MFNLTPQQLQVVDALSGGATLTDAAAQAGIHRNTIANWRLNSPDFHEALTTAHYDRAVLYRDRAVDLADLAFEALRKVLTNPESSPSALLRAATFVIEKASAPPVFEKEKPASMADLFAAMTEFDRSQFSQAPPAEPAKNAQECTNMHNLNPHRQRNRGRAPSSTCTILHNRRKPIAVPNPKSAATTYAPAATARNISTAVSARPRQPPPRSAGDTAPGHNMRY